MKKLTLLFVVLLAFLISCQLQKVMVKIYTPPKLVIPPDIRSFLVTSRYVPATGPYEDVQWGAYESVDSLKWALAESLVDTLAKRMVVDNKYYVKVRHLPRMLRHNDASLPDPLPWEGVSVLSKKEFVQAVLVMEGFGLTKTPVAVSENSGNYEARYSIGVTMALRIYEPDKMRVIDDSVYTFSSEFKGAGKTREEAVLQLSDERKALILACSNAAEAYFALINPGEISEKRSYYLSSDSSMLKAGQAVKEGKWGRAETKWKWVAYNSKDSIIQAKASFNMALVCERDGRLNQAIGFARRSQRLKPDNHTREYINVLNKRISEFEDQINQKTLIKRW